MESLDILYVGEVINIEQLLTSQTALARMLRDRFCESRIVSRPGRCEPDNGRIGMQYDFPSGPIEARLWHIFPEPRDEFRAEGEDILPNPG